MDPVKSPAQCQLTTGKYDSCKPFAPPKKTYFTYIGIDCGVETGIGVWVHAAKKFAVIETVKIHKAMELVKNCFRLQPGFVLVRVEDARLREWLPKEKNMKEYRGKLMGAGSVKRDAKIWEDYLTDLGVDFEMVAPKNNKTKVSAAYFQKVSGYQGPTSQHARDAAMLVIGY